MICKYMGWSWDEVQATPMDVLAVVIDMIQQEHTERERAAAKAAMRRRHGS